MIELLSQKQDDSVFLEKVKNILDEIILNHNANALLLIKIDNWFGERWVGFSGKILGAVGIRHTDLRIPPFVPNRVISERYFVFEKDFVEKPFPKRVHVSIDSEQNIKRKVSEFAPETIFFWYSGNTEKNGRGSVMVYLPKTDEYIPWFISFRRDGVWKVDKTIGISSGDLNNHIGISN